MLSKTGSLKGKHMWTDFGTIGKVSKGLSVQSNKFRYVKRFHRKNATRLDKDQLNFDLN